MKSWYCERLPSQMASATAPELVLLHGWGMSSEVFRDWLPLLRRRCNVTLLDLPGFGRSPPQSQLRIDALLDQLAHYVPLNSALLGWSLGGAIATKFTARFPERCAALMTVASNPCFVERADWLSAMSRTTFTEFQTQLEHNPAATLRRFLMLQTRGSDGERDLLRWLRAVETKASSEALAWGLGLLAQLDVRDELRDSNVPGLHIFGSADALVPASVAENISHIAPQHWTVLLDSAAHLPFVSHAELCWQHLDRLLSSAGLLQRAPFAQRSKRAVAQSFGNAAASYDNAAQLQRDVANNLLRQSEFTAQQTELSTPKTLLDIGCGTGGISAQLAKSHAVVALDLAEGMLRYARVHHVDENLTWLCGDAENLPLAGASIDTIFSSLALQWSENPGAAFIEIARVLRDGGSAYIATLGPHTLHELRNAWQQADDRVHVNGFIAREQLNAAVARAGLTVQSWREENIMLRYRELRELTRELKSIGAHNVNSGRPDGLTSRARLQRFSAAYETQRDTEGFLPATYQVWYLRLGKECSKSEGAF